jgi:hypothetical protein
MSTTGKDSLILDFLEIVSRGLPRLAKDGDVLPWQDEYEKPRAAAAWTFDEKFAPVAEFLVAHFRTLDAKDTELEDADPAKRPALTAGLRNDCIFFSIVAGYLVLLWRNTQAKNPSIGPVPADLVRAYETVYGAARSHEEWIRLPVLDARLKEAVGADTEDLQPFPGE